MMYVRTRYLCLFVAGSDATLIGGGVPLQKYSWDLASSGNADVHSILVALVANLAMLVVALCGLMGGCLLLQRGAFFMIKHFAATFVRSSLMQRTRLPR